MNDVDGFSFDRQCKKELDYDEVWILEKEDVAFVGENFTKGGEERGEVSDILSSNNLFGNSLYFHGPSCI